ncbi:hypothetical protein ONZ43_g960 [Nemania bipapillata]|uniref:Uncharacterized protein n=1 Tax=Nemania bipapillata TaxID=110536 RepID=A0ACC2J678_9PEZI|nr:hypothetical protein ONZ43_g960 [Nemania bipapillata]
MPPARTRKNLVNLTTKERDNLVRAFIAIQKLEPSDPDSYFIIAGYHGIPGSYYCHHGDVLFPTWHRAYLSRLEKALQKQVDGVTVPYWAQLFTLDQSMATSAIPTILTDKDYKFADGTSVPNPLFSYKLQQMIEDDGKGDGGHQVGLYNKPQGYNTVRYPFSGLVSKGYEDQTTEHNKIYAAMGADETTGLLNTNVLDWLFKPSYINDKGETLPAGAGYKYTDCLDAPNYTVFSNVTSSQQWNGDHTGVVYSLENPHNIIHAAVGGYEVPGDDSLNKIYFANGDMGENETAAFDPIFFFHHCWIDYLFWNWQVRCGSTDSLEFMRPGYPGVENYTPDSPLDPFMGQDGRTPLTSQDVADIGNLGYSYDRLLQRLRDSNEEPVPYPRLRIRRLSRRNIVGTFLISAWVTDDQGKDKLIGVDAILSRWDLSNCSNCQEHLDFDHFVPLLGWSDEDANLAFNAEKFKYKLHTRDNRGGLVGDPRGNGPQLELETSGGP